MNTQNVSGHELSKILDGFLINVAILSFLTVGFIHYFFIIKLFHPLKKLTQASQNINRGVIPPVLSISRNDEIGKLTKSFNSMLHTLSSIQFKQETMLRDLAHELRTPLTNLNGYLEGLTTGLIKGERLIYQSLLDESNRITRLVEQITTFNAWQEDKGFLTAPFEVLSTKKMIDDSLQAFELKLKATLKMNVSIEDVSVSGHEDGLKQVFYNILQNVVDYDVGGWLIIDGKVDQNYYNLRFKHEGQQIPKDKANEIFERFYRIDSSRRLNTEGGGLGLAIAREIIESHEGTIELVTDEYIHIFCVKLPILER